MNNRELKPPYGFIYMNILKNRNLIQTDKLVYAIIAAKQGTTDKAIITTSMLADALGLSQKTIRESLQRLTKHELIEKLSQKEYQAISSDGQYGVIELDIMTTSNLSNAAKYLYLIYSASSNDYDANFRGREMICKDFQMGNTTYMKAHKELIELGLLNIIKQASGPNIQAVNINIISRAKQITLQTPASWQTQEVFDLDVWCEDNLNDPSQESKKEVSGMESGSFSNPKEEVLMQRSVTINSNLNRSSSKSNETNGFPIVHSSEGTDILNDKLSEDMSEDELLTEIRKVATAIKKEAERISEMISDSDSHSEVDLSQVKGLTQRMRDLVIEASSIDSFELEDHKYDTKVFHTKKNTLVGIIECFADPYFVSVIGIPCEIEELPLLIDEAFQYLEEIRMITKQHTNSDTSSYGINVNDIYSLVDFKNKYQQSEESIMYHVGRVAELGLTSENKKYIGFSYVFSENVELKHAPLY